MTECPICGIADCSADHTDDLWEVADGKPWPRPEPADYEEWLEWRGIDATDEPNWLP